MEDKTLTEQMASQTDEARYLRHTITDCKTCEAIIRKDEADKMIRAGFIQRDEFQRQIDATDYTAHLVAKARQEALREVGRLLAMYFVEPSPYLRGVLNALKSGRMPEGK